MTATDSLHRVEEAVNRRGRYTGPPCGIKIDVTRAT